MYCKMGELQAKEDYTKRNEKFTDAGKRAGLFQLETIKDCEAKVLDLLGLPEQYLVWMVSGCIGYHSPSIGPIF
jgi:hypothetical protein